MVACTNRWHEAALNLHTLLDYIFFFSHSVFVSMNPCTIFLLEPLDLPYRSFMMIHAFFQRPSPFQCKPYSNAVNVFLSASDYWEWIALTRIKAEREATERLASGTTLKSWKEYCLRFFPLILAIVKCLKFKHQYIAHPATFCGNKCKNR